MSALPGDPANLERVSGAAYFTPAGELGQISLGDVILHRMRPEVQTRIVRRAHRGGIIASAREDITGVDLAWELQLQEQLTEAIELQLMGTASGLIEEAAGATTVTFTGAVPRRYYPLAGTPILTAEVRVGLVVKTEGLDYEVDYELAKLRVMEAGTIPPDAILTINLELAGVARQSFDGLTRPTLYGVLEVSEFDGRTGATEAGALVTYTVPCALRIIEWPERNVEGMSQHTMLATAIGPMRAVRRIVPQTEILVDETTDPVTTDAGELIYVAGFGLSFAA